MLGVLDLQPGQAWQGEDRREVGDVARGVDFQAMDLRQAFETLERLGSDWPGQLEPFELGKLANLVEEILVDRACGENAKLLARRDAAEALLHPVVNADLRIGRDAQSGAEFVRLAHG